MIVEFHGTIIHDLLILKILDKQFSETMPNQLNYGSLID